MRKALATLAFAIGFVLPPSALPAQIPTFVDSFTRTTFEGCNLDLSCHRLTMEIGEIHPIPYGDIQIRTGLRFYFEHWFNLPGAFDWYSHSVTAYQPENQLELPSPDAGVIENYSLYYRAGPRTVWEDVHVAPMVNCRDWSDLCEGYAFTKVFDVLPVWSGYDVGLSHTLGLRYETGRPGRYQTIVLEKASVSTIPEPLSAALVPAALAGLLWRRRRGWPSVGPSSTVGAAVDRHP